jgi:hypothetical protein
MAAAPMAATLIEKGQVNPRLYDGCRSTKWSMQRKTFFLPLREISHHTGIFSGRFFIPMGGIFPPCRNFSDRIPIPKAGIHSLSF